MQLRSAENTNVALADDSPAVRAVGPPQFLNDLALTTDAQEIKVLARAMTVGDAEWLRSVRARMLRGQANHIETFFLSHLFGKPKDPEQPAERTPILFISAFGPPGS